MTDFLIGELATIVALTPKMAVAALLVVTATIASERLGPAIGALIATLPVSTGPAYVFLAMDHTPQFIAQSALATIVFNLASATLATAYVVLAQRCSLLRSAGFALLLWLLGVGLSFWIDWSTSLALAATLGVYPVCMLVVRPYRNASATSKRVRLVDIAIRALAVSALVAIIETVGRHAGAETAGLLTAFPIVLICMIVILHLRLGARAAAAVLAHSIPGMMGVTAALFVLHGLAVPLGSPLALALALCLSVAWNLALFALHQMYRAGPRTLVLPGTFATAQNQ